MKIITIEEHFMSAKVDARYKALKPPRDPLEANQASFVDRFVAKGAITDVGAGRLAFMNDVGIDAQIIGYGNHSPMHLKKEEDAVPLCRLANDELYRAMRSHPDRFYGYATLPVDDVSEAVSELDRCVKELGFKGIMINGPFRGHFLDEGRFFPIFERAAVLQVPVYLHPSEISATIRQYYYEGSWNDRTANTFAGFAIGWHYETAMHLMRLILSGIFDKLPRLKVIVGHWAEMLPFYFDRMNASLPSQMTGLKHDIKYYFRNHVYTNPSGMFFSDNMDFCLKTFAPDHILWAQDYPYGINNEQVRSFLEEYEMDPGRKEQIAHGNAEKLFNL